MDEISVFDAKNTLSALLNRVERGEQVVITRRGKPVARLMPLFDDDRRSSAVDRLDALRARISAKGETMSWTEVKDYRDEGRR